MLFFPSLLCHVLNACGRQPIPSFIEPIMENMTALKGQDVEFVCEIENLGRHMVAFLKADIPPRLIAFDESVFRQRDKYEIRSKANKGQWILIVKDVQESDVGGYACQLNTDPVVSRIGYLHLRVPPYVARTTASAVEVREGDNVTLSCRAFGNPTPTVVWRRQDRQIIRFNGATGYGASVYNGSDLVIMKVSRKHMSEYVCVASNGIPPDESWTVKLHVTFEPLVIPQSKLIIASIGSQSSLVCNVEAWPRALLKWEKDGNEIFDTDKYAMTQQIREKYRSTHILTIKDVSRNEYGIYRCTVMNDNGIHFCDITLEDSITESKEIELITEGSDSIIDDVDETDADTVGIENTDIRKYERSNSHTLLVNTQSSSQLQDNDVSRQKSQVLYGSASSFKMTLDRGIIIVISAKLFALTLNTLL